MLKVQEKILLFDIRVRHSQNSFERLITEHVSALKRFFLFKLPRQEDAEDACNITLLRLWNYLLTAEVENVSGLIFTIARSVVAEFYRNRKIELLPIEGHESSGGNPEEKYEDWMDVEIIKKRMLEIFNEEEQLIFQLRFFEGLPVGEIAKKIPKSENATRVTLHRLLKRLRVDLSKRYDE